LASNTKEAVLMMHLGDIKCWFINATAKIIKESALVVFCPPLYAERKYLLSLRLLCLYLLMPNQI
jgi:hypothetical protein